MNTVRKNIPERNPESYSPKKRPEILDLAERAKSTGENPGTAEVRTLPRIITRDSLVIAGVAGDGDKTCKLWQQFTELNKIVPLKNKMDDNNYEVRIYSDNGECRCHVGICVKEPAVPAGYELLTVPGSMYAAFDVCPVQGYESQNEAMDRWLKDNGELYEQIRMDNDYFSVLLYDKRYKGESDPESIVEIGVPITAIHDPERRSHE